MATELCSLNLYLYSAWTDPLGDDSLCGYPWYDDLRVSHSRYDCKDSAESEQKGILYPSQAHYDFRYTIRMGFVFAGYRIGYEWWEAVVMIRKCAFVLLSIFLRTYGASPQVVAASMVLFAAGVIIAPGFVLPG